MWIDDIDVLRHNVMFYLSMYKMPC